MRSGVLTDEVIKKFSNNYVDPIVDHKGYVDSLGGIIKTKTHQTF